MDIWNNNTHKCWLELERKYFNLVKPENIVIEKKLESMDVENVKKMNSEEFYNFLYCEYFVWKYTAKNRLATTRKNLEKHKLNLIELMHIHNEIFSFDMNDIEQGLKIAMKIHGLGVAGASGLLSILFPEYFGTVDQFVVLRLREFETFNNNLKLNKINENGLLLKDGVLLIEILRDKAYRLNKENNINYWTPRKIDKALWAFNR